MDAICILQHGHVAVESSLNLVSKNTGPSFGSPGRPISMARETGRRGRAEPSCRKGEDPRYELTSGRGGASFCISPPNSRVLLSIERRFEQVGSRRKATRNVLARKIGN